MTAENKSSDMEELDNANAIQVWGFVLINTHDLEMFQYMLNCNYSSDLIHLR